MKRFLFLFLMFSFFSNAQKIIVYQINADWNKHHTLELNLKNCKYILADIEQIAPQVKKNILSLPAILIYKDGRNRRQYMGGIDLKLDVTEKEIQEFINELKND